MVFEWEDWVVIGVYFITVLGTGLGVTLLSRKNSKDTTGFLLAGRSMSFIPEIDAEETLAWLLFQRRDKQEQTASPALISKTLPKHNFRRMFNLYFLYIKLKMNDCNSSSRGCTGHANKMTRANVR